MEQALLAAVEPASFGDVASGVAPVTGPRLAGAAKSEEELFGE